MEESRWEKFKKHDKLEPISIDEGIVLIIGLFILFFQTYSIAFILLVIIWYWFKVRYYERKIIKKRKRYL